MEASISTPWAVVPVAGSAVGAYELITGADSATGEPPGDPSKDSTEDSACDRRELVNLEPTQLGSVRRRQTRPDHDSAN